MSQAVEALLHRLLRYSVFLCVGKYLAIGPLMTRCHDDLVNVLQLGEEEDPVAPVSV